MNQATSILFTSSFHRHSFLVPSDRPGSCPCVLWLSFAWQPVERHGLVVIPPEMLRWIILVRVIVVGTLAIDVVLVVHVLGILLGLAVGLLSVPLVHTLGLGELVDFTTDNASQEFLGESVGDGLACNGNILLASTEVEMLQKLELTFLALLVFKELEALESSPAGDQFMGELSLVFGSSVSVHLLVSILRFIWKNTTTLASSQSEGLAEGVSRYTPKPHILGVCKVCSYVSLIWLG